MKLSPLLKIGKMKFDFQNLGKCRFKGYLINTRSKWLGEVNTHHLTKQENN